MTNIQNQDKPQDAESFDEIEGPLFYALPQSVRDGLAAHFRGLMPDCADTRLPEQELRQAA